MLRLLHASAAHALTRSANTAQEIKQEIARKVIEEAPRGRSTLTVRIDHLLPHDLDAVRGWLTDHGYTSKPHPLSDGDFLDVIW